jgi:hypothetical protein
LAARTIGELASVDGCVVLDRSLSVIAFGAKIHDTPDAARDSRIQFRNAKTGQEVPLEELEKLGGTRLGSALRFCKCHSNVLVFVISQDQEMKLLWSEGDRAFAFGPISFSTINAFE